MLTAFVMRQIHNCTAV